MPAEDDLTAIVEIERLINEAARTQPGSERVRLSKALEDAVGKVVRQPQQHVAGEEALNNARADAARAINTVRVVRMVGWAFGSRRPPHRIKAQSISYPQMS